MPNSEKGFVPLVVIILVFVITVSTGVVVKESIPQTPISIPNAQPLPSINPSPTPSVSPTPVNKITTNQQAIKPSPTSSGSPTTATNSSSNNSNGSSSNTNTSTTQSDQTTQSSLGLELSKTSVDLTIESGKSAKAFDIKSTGATQFSLYGYPTTYGPGINWSVSSGGTTNGQTTPVEIKVNDGINPATYTGTAVVKNQSGQEISIPVRVTVTRGSTSRFVKVTSPNGGETLKAGDKINIAYDYNDIDSCTFGFSFGEGSLNSITSGVNPTGSYEWTVNVGNISINRQVKIDLLCYKTGIGSVHDQSDSFFTVTP